MSNWTSKYGFKRTSILNDECKVIVNLLKPVNQKDLNLILAAPQMFEALHIARIRLEAYLGEGIRQEVDIQCTQTIIDVITDAINKAEGLE